MVIYTPDNQGGRLVLTEVGLPLRVVEMRELERQNIEAALNQSDGRIYGSKGAACLLGIPPTTLTARINKMGIKKR